MRQKLFIPDGVMDILLRSGGHDSGTQCIDSQNPKEHVGNKLTSLEDFTKADEKMTGPVPRELFGMLKSVQIRRWVPIQIGGHCARWASLDRTYPQGCQGKHRVLKMKMRDN
jgi:hypothetical protein